MNFVNYVIQDHTRNDFSSKWKPSMKCDINEDTLEYIAEEIAENHYSDDPCNPEDYECVVGVRWNDITKWFKISAEMSVDFNVNETEAP